MPKKGEPKIRVEEGSKSEVIRDDEGKIVGTRSTYTYEDASSESTTKKEVTVEEETRFVNDYLVHEKERIVDHSDSEENVEWEKERYRKFPEFKV